MAASPPDQTPSIPPIGRAEVVLPGEPLPETIALFERMGFRLDAIFPADNPTVASLSGHGVRLRLDATLPRATAGTVRLQREAESSGALPPTITAPNGTGIEWAEPSTLHVPHASVKWSAADPATDSAWVTGRAGMQYRDLIPGRCGGRYVASQIRIDHDGPVPDYVHHHQVRVQFIYCLRGEVQLVYEDQGPPFWLRPGDCVLQPPEIRHRVLHASAGLEVLEFGCPAEHLTRVDHELELPTSALAPDRDFSGQRFVRHVAATAAWRPWLADGLRRRDLELARASDGICDAGILRAEPGTSVTVPATDAELCFWFGIGGQLAVRAGTDAVELSQGTALSAPGDRAFDIATKNGAEFLLVAVASIA